MVARCRFLGELTDPIPFKRDLNHFQDKHRQAGFGSNTNNRLNLNGDSYWNNVIHASFCHKDDVKRPSNPPLSLLPAMHGVERITDKKHRNVFLVSRANAHHTQWRKTWCADSIQRMPLRERSHSYTASSNRRHSVRKQGPFVYSHECLNGPCISRRNGTSQAVNNATETVKTLLNRKRILLYRVCCMRSNPEC